MNASMTLSGEQADRVRSNTNPDINARIDRDLEMRIRFYAAQDPQAISERLEELDREWDIERLLQTNAAAVSLTGLLFSLLGGRKWLVLPIAVSGFLLQHAVQGWCPPLPLFRKMKVRTRSEIEQERYALKMLRGDFDTTEGARDPEDIARQVRQ
jgi:hypothetical protein